MLKENLANRLNNLFYDLRCSNRDLLVKLFMYNLTSEDREAVLREMYESDFLPIKVNKITDNITQDRCDMDLVEKYLQGFDKYLKSQQREIDEVIRNNQIAVRIFLHILELEGQKCNVMYLLYYRKMDVDKAMKSLYMSKSSFFRLKRAAFADLYELVNNDEELKDV